MNDPRGGIDSPPVPAGVGLQAGSRTTPAPADVEPPAPAVLKHFEFGHLDGDLAEVSRMFHALAHELAGRFRGDELEEALKQLVSAKDWAVRAALARRGR